MESARRTRFLFLKYQEDRILKHQDMLEKMTLEEKAAFLSGKNVWQTRDFSRLGLPSICCSDGPHGVRKQAGAGDHLGLNASLPATCFPTWNRRNSAGERKPGRKFKSITTAIC